MEIYKLSMLVLGIHGFNIDTDHVINFRGDPGSYFGYSAVMLRNAEGPWAVVGSIKANFSNEPAIDTPGNVYKCKIDFEQKTTPCAPMDIRSQDMAKWPDLPGFEEDKELLGASMAVIDEKLVICAPLWKNMIPLRRSGFVHPTGICFNVDKSLDVDTVTTQMFKADKLNKTIRINRNDLTYEMAEIGFAISPKKFPGSRLNVLLGAPGFIENKGGFLQYSATDTSNNFYDFFTSNSFDSNDQKDAIDQCSQMGYSITSGTLSAYCNNAIVLGTPHFNSTSGIVGAALVVCAYGVETTNKTLSVKKQFTGEKSGSGFGASVVFDDINNDGLDDLLVGAPLYFDKVLDGGAVYIYYGVRNRSDLLRVSAQKLLGKEEFGRFGSAIQIIGDVNKDSFSDVAVGAPYENNLRGAVYIYHGGRNKLTFTQKIKAQEIDPGLKSFGWYIGTAQDIDNDGYSDFVVGSYMSDQISILRARPIIDLRSTVDVSPSIIPLNSSGLHCQDPTFRPCVTIRLCFSYHGDNVPDFLSVSFNITSDTKRTKAGKVSRVSLYTDTRDFDSPNIREKTITITKESEKCMPYYAVVQNVNREFFMSLTEMFEVEASYGLSIGPIPGQVSPILNNVPSVIYSSANFSTGCEGECRPDLVITAILDHEIIKLGETNEILVQVRVINTGDLSHGSQISIKTSNNTKYIGFFQPQNEPTEPVLCKDIKDNNNVSTVICQLRSTLFQQQQAIFSARFAVSRELLIGEHSTLGAFNQKISFSVEAETTSSDDNPSDNIQTLTATVKLQSLVQLKGISTPDQLTVSEKANKLLNFVHTYDIHNRGPSPLFRGTIHICIPVYNQEGKQMVSRDFIKVNGNSPRLQWKLAQFPGDTSSPHETNQNIVSTTTKRLPDLQTTTLPPRDGASLNRRRRAAEKLSQNEQSGNKIKEISCNTIEESRQAILEVTNINLEKDEEDTFEVHVNISEDSLNFAKTSKIIFKSIGTVKSENDDRFIITPMNGTTEVPSDIFPKEPTLETQQVNIWIIVGGCVGGLLLLILLGVTLWKCGFFKRKKKDDLRKWKRQSGYYAKRQSMRVGSTKSSNYKPVDEWN